MSLLLEKVVDTNLPVQCCLSVLTVSPHKSGSNHYRGELLFIVPADLTPAEDIQINVNTQISLTE